MATTVFTWRRPFLLAELADASTYADSGRGLMIVQALAKEWGCSRLPACGKTVYAVVQAE